MRLSKQQTAENRSRILETAIRMFRQRGVEGAGIADLMQASGFTHGGFYNHFRSKDALVTEAARLSLGRAETTFARSLEGTAPDAWEKYVASSVARALSPEPGDDASLAALAIDAGRQGIGLQRVVARSVEQLTSVLSEYLVRAGAVEVDGGPSATRGLALHRLSSLVGAWVLARAVSRASPELARDILRANRRWLNASEVRANASRPRRRRSARQ